MEAQAFSEGHGLTLDRTRVRERGHDRVPFGSKMPKELVVAAEKIGRGNRSGGVERLLDIAVDAMKEIGDDLWVRVELYAHENKITEGEALGRLALDALKKRRQ